jgi:hypothetical protein
MASIIPKIKTRFGENIGVELFVTHPNLSSNETTFISADASSAVGSLSVENGLKFSTGEFIVVGSLGAEKSEIIRIHTSTTPTASTITLNSNTTLAHSRGDRITFIPYDQVVIQRSTDGGTSYSDLATISLRADTTEIYYQHTAGASTDLYKVKFKNSATSNESELSDGIIATGFVENSAGAIIREALLALGEKVDDEVLTKEFLFSALNEGRSEIDEHRDINKWSFRTVFDYDAGNIIPGQYQLTVPSDLRDPDTYQNILAVRIGKDKFPLQDVDKRRMNEHYRGVAHTTLNGAVITSDTEIDLTSSGDFNESGSIDIAAQAVNETIDNVEYTANDESTNQISGVTGIRAAGHATLTNVWQGVSFGSPREYTVFEDKITFSQPFSNELDGENIWLDYYKKITAIDSDGDLLDEPFFKIYIPYMRYRMKLRKNPQLQREGDDDYKSWLEKKEAQVDKNFTSQDLRIQIDVPDSHRSGLRSVRGNIL